MEMLRAKLHERNQDEYLTTLAADNWQPATLANRQLATSHTTPQLLRAWLPFTVLSLCVLLWGVPAIKNAINRATTPAFERGGWDVPLLHRAVIRAAPVVARPTPEPAKYDFNWLSATGSACFVAALISAVLLGVRPRRLLR